MAAPIPLRDDFDGPTLRYLAKASDDANQTRRLLALAVIYDGSPRGEAARVGGVGRQIIRDWVLRFNAEGPSGLIDRKAPGPAPRLKAEHRQALAAMVDSGPIPAVHGVVRWRLKDLAHWVFTECGVALDETTIGRAVRALGYRKISARPRHPAQHALAIADVKKTFSATLDAVRAKLRAGTAIEVWWQDEARIGQKNKLTRRWAKRGTRPQAPHDHRTQSVYLFGTICLQRGVDAGLVLPRCNTHAMQCHVQEMSAQVTPGAHAVVLLDQAGWHTSRTLVISPNMTLLPLPPRSPELNPVENVWQFLRENWLSNRVFKSYDDIVALSCEAWNELTKQPWKIMSLGLRD